MTLMLGLFATVGGIGGLSGIAAIAYIGVTRRKIRAEARQLDVSAEDVLSGRALEMYDRAMKAAQRAEQKAERAEHEVRALRDHVDHLERIMRDAGLTPPVYAPPAWKAPSHE